MKVDSELQSRIDETVKQADKEVHRLLPELPGEITARFDNSYLIPETGTGGFADHGNVIVLAFAEDFDDRVQQLANLRASYYHEAYHLAQGWVGDTILGAIDEAVLEGAATVFERDKAESRPPWADYFEQPKMLDLLQQLRDLPNDYDVGKWKYMDPATHRRWLLYRVGTFVVDEALRHNPDVSIESLAAQSADEILSLAELE